MVRHGLPHPNGRLPPETIPRKWLSSLGFRMFPLSSRVLPCIASNKASHFKSHLLLFSSCLSKVEFTTSLNKSRSNFLPTPSDASFEPPILFRNALFLPHRLLKSPFNTSSKGMNYSLCSSVETCLSSNTYSSNLLSQHFGSPRQVDKAIISLTRQLRHFQHRHLLLELVNRVLILPLDKFTMWPTQLLTASSFACYLNVVKLDDYEVVNIA